MTTQKFSSLLKNTHGANIVEYVVLVAIMAVLAIVTFQNLGESVRKKVDDQKAQIDSQW